MNRGELVTVVVGCLASEDAEALEEIDSKCFTTEAFNSPDWMSLGEQTETIFISLNGKKIAAAVWQWYPYAATAYLLSNAVLPEYRQHGYGSYLLEARIKSARRRFIEFAFAHTRASNGPSQRLLRRNGFEPNSIVPWFYDEEDAIEWKMKLS